MNIDNNLILIKGEDKTASVTSWRFDAYKPVVFITYNGKQEYPYSTTQVIFLKDPKIIEASTANENHAYDIANLYKWSTTPKYNPDDYSYSIMVVGDTQVVSQYNARDLALGKITEGNTYMDMIYDYIVDSIDDKNVKFVVGLGDVTQFNAKNEWEEALRVTSKLNNKVPYSIARGNHDLATGTWAGSSYLGNKTNKHEFEPYFIYDYWDGTSGTAAAENANINWNYCNTYYTQYFGNKYNSAYTSQFAYT